MHGNFVTRLGMKKVIELIRVSSESRPSEHRFNISAQHAINQHTAERYGLTVVRSIELVNVSGAAVLKTPEMQDLLRVIQDPEITGVVVREFSRLMRPECFGDYVLFQAFQESGTLLYLPEGPIDFNTRSGRLIGTVRAAISGLERDEHHERSWMAKEILRRAGKHPQSHTSLPSGVGYDKVGKWFYTPEAERIKQAFRLFLSGQTNYRRLSRQLGFNHWTLSEILRNPIYCGWRVIHKRRDPSPFAMRTRIDGRRADCPRITRTPEEVIRVRVIDKPLIREDEFNRVQNIIKLKKQAHRYYHPNSNVGCTLAGFLRCGACGSRLHSRSGNKYYACKNQYEKHGCKTKWQHRRRLKQIITELFVRQLRDDAFLRHIVALQGQESDARESETDIETIRANLNLLEQKRGRILELFQARLISPKERNERLGAVCRDVDLMTETLLRKSPSRKLSISELTSVVRPLAAWKAASNKRRRRILFANVAAIHVVNCQILGISMHLQSKR